MTSMATPSAEASANDMAALKLSDPAPDPERSVIVLLQRSQGLMVELEQFKACLKEKKQDKTVELRHFSTNLQSEIKSLGRLANLDPENEKVAHTISSSNFPFYSAVWNTAKGCKGITALRKRFFWCTGQTLLKSKKGDLSAKSNIKSVEVDIVAGEDLEWVKVNTITARRMIFDLAKAGWAEDDSTDDEDDDLVRLDTEDEPEGLLKQAKLLVEASKLARTKYRHPSVRLVLPRLTRNCPRQVANVLQEIRALGVTVQTFEDIPTSPEISKVLHRMVVDPFEKFSGTLNVDCTMIFSFISDLSHGRVEPKDWHHRFLIKQMEMESKDQLLPSIVWPACGTRKLVCTREAVVRAQEIVDTIGTNTEKQRMELLFDSNHESMRDKLAEEFQKLSEYSIPLDWQLPISVVDVDIPTIVSELPLVAKDVSNVLTGVNQSVFLYGWASGLTTISSNRVVAKEIEATIEANRGSVDVQGPEIWLSPMARSLVGKEKQRRGAKD
ncbi:hypothetical protein MFRU_034g00360 [Monilinia fructicola]|uniref:DUF1308 domain-containing protein n=1 Tax=Monilinia fructicola TaxID=38448 RepID=A0A5M9JKC0_MONFR|nr:hypothetical protein EYC84_008578 [Monilinia fructicola]KAG4026976.1 hypothetical protein MFRU_034g00360 [Monilinia fructicola]